MFHPSSLVWLLSSAARATTKKNFFWVSLAAFVGVAAINPRVKRPSSSDVTIEIEHNDEDIRNGHEDQQWSDVDAVGSLHEIKERSEESSSPTTDDSAGAGPIVPNEDDVMTMRSGVIRETGTAPGSPRRSSLEMARRSTADSSDKLSDVGVVFDGSEKTDADGTRIVDDGAGAVVDDSVVDEDVEMLPHRASTKGTVGAQKVYVCESRKFCGVRATL